MLKFVNMTYSVVLTIKKETSLETAMNITTKKHCKRVTIRAKNTFGLKLTSTLKSTGQKILLLKNCLCMRRISCSNLIKYCMLLM